MDSLKEALQYLKEGINQEITQVRKLKGKRLKKFIDHFCLEEPIELYYNDYNLIIVDPHTLEEVLPYMKEKDLIIRVNVAEYNCDLLVYQYFKNKLVNEYIKD